MVDGCIDTLIGPPDTLPLLSIVTDTVWEVRSGRENDTVYVPGTCSPPIRKWPTWPTLCVCDCTVVRPSVAVTVTPGAGLLPGSSKTAPCSAPADVPRVIWTPVSFWPDASVRDSVWDAWSGAVAVSVKLPGVGSPRRVNFPRFAASVSDTVVTLVWPAVAVIVTPCSGPDPSVTRPEMSPSPLRKVSCTPVRCSPPETSSCCTVVAYPVLTTTS